MGLGNGAVLCRLHQSGVLHLPRLSGVFPAPSRRTRHRTNRWRTEAVGQPWLLATSAISVTVRLAFAAVLIGGLWSSRHMPFVPDIGEVLAQTNLNTDTLSMGHILNLTAQSFAALRLPAILAVIALIFGSLTELILCFRRRTSLPPGLWQSP